MPVLQVSGCLASGAAGGWAGLVPVGCFAGVAGADQVEVLGDEDLGVRQVSRWNLKVAEVVADLASARLHSPVIAADTVSVSVSQQLCFGGMKRQAWLWEQRQRWRLGH